MSLLASYRTQNNTEVRERVTAAILAVAVQRHAWQGPAGKLAQRALVDMPTVLTPFLQLVSVNETVAQNACPNCGCAWRTSDGTQIDASIRCVIENKWDEVAKRFYPDPAATDEA
jgi:hypothetical protein